MDEQTDRAALNCDTTIINMVAFKRRLQDGEITRGDDIDSDTVSMLMCEVAAMQALLTWCLNSHMDLDYPVTWRLYEESNEDELPF